MQVDLDLELGHLEQVMGQAMDSLLAKFSPEETAHLAWRGQQAQQGQQPAELAVEGGSAPAEEEGGEGQQARTGGEQEVEGGSKEQRRRRC